jgi:hypothetical protein
MGFFEALDDFAHRAVEVVVSWVDGDGAESAARTIEHTVEAAGRAVEQVAQRLHEAPVPFGGHWEKVEVDSWVYD